ncbi:MAG: hypothetical protein V3W09_03695 [Nitrososphaerales archaeon]
MSIPEFYGSLDSIMILLFVVTVTLILVYEFNLHRRVRKSAH